MVGFTCNLERLRVFQSYKHIIISHLVEKINKFMLVILGERETELVTGLLGLFFSKKHLKKGYRPMKKALFIKHVSFDQVLL
jgi:hypothetical protein